MELPEDSLYYSQHHFQVALLQGLLTAGVQKILQHGNQKLTHPHKQCMLKSSNVPAAQNCSSSSFAAKSGKMSCEFSTNNQAMLQERQDDMRVFKRVFVLTGSLQGHGKIAFEAKVCHIRISHAVRSLSERLEEGSGLYENTQRLQLGQDGSIVYLKTGAVLERTKSSRSRTKTRGREGAFSHFSIPSVAA